MPEINDRIGARYRHLGRGGLYSIASVEYAPLSVAENVHGLTWVTAFSALLGVHARVQGVIDAGARAVFYLADKDRTLWVRSHHEFFDGRFEDVTPAVLKAPIAASVFDQIDVLADQALVGSFKADIDAVRGFLATARASLTTPLDVIGAAANNAGEA